jgi:hypothetical protein
MSKRGRNPEKRRAAIAMAFSPTKDALVSLEGMKEKFQFGDMR